MIRTVLMARQGFTEALAILHDAEAPRHIAVTLVPEHHHGDLWVYKTRQSGRHNKSEDELLSLYRQMLLRMGGCLERINPTASAVGMGDLTGVLQGEALSVELKTGTHRICPDSDWRVSQRRFAKRWVAAGGVYVLTNVLFENISQARTAMLPHKRSGREGS